MPCYEDREDKARAYARLAEDRGGDPYECLTPEDKLRILKNLCVTKPTELEGMLCEALKPQFEGTEMPPDVRDKLQQWFLNHRAIEKLR